MATQAEIEAAAKVICEPLPGREVLPNQIEEKGALAGAGLPDDVEMPAPLLGIEHDGLARDAGADADLLTWCFHGRNGAGVPCAPQVGTWCGQHPCSAGARRSYMASSSPCPHDLTAEPPAHCRLFPTTIFSRSWSSRIVPPPLSRAHVRWTFDCRKIVALQQVKRWATN